MDNLILKVSTKVLFTPIILFGLYVQFHGDFGPGGGFQAGVIVAASFILYSMVFSLSDCKKIMPPKANFFLLVFGAFLYGFVGVVSLILGEIAQQKQMSSRMIPGSVRNDAASQLLSSFSSEIDEFAQELKKKSA